MTSIYDQHDKAFQQVAAYVVMKGADRVATIAFKFPRDGAGRLWAYVHWIGQPMVRAHAGGYGYDKRSAACSSAVGRMPAELPVEYYADGTPCCSIDDQKQYAAFYEALMHDDGSNWDRRLREFGFELFQAV